MPDDEQGRPQLCQRTKKTKGQPSWLSLGSEHELTPEPTGCEVVHRVTFSGLLSWVIGPMLSRQLNVGLPVTLGRLKQRAEQRAIA